VYVQIPKRGAVWNEPTPLRLNGVSLSDVIVQLRHGSVVKLYAVEAGSSHSGRNSLLHRELPSICGKFDTSSCAVRPFDLPFDRT
jgi:hypothetical protein